MIRRLKVFVMRTVAKRKPTYIKTEIVFPYKIFLKRVECHPFHTRRQMYGSGTTAQPSALEEVLTD